MRYAERTEDCPRCGLDVTFFTSEFDESTWARCPHCEEGSVRHDREPPTQNDPTPGEE